MKDNKIFLERAAILSKTEEVVNKSNQSDLLVFNVNSEKYAVKYQYVKRVIASHLITPIPLAPPVLSGIYYDEGNIISVMSASALFFGKSNPTESNLMLLMNGDDIMGFL